MQQPDKDQIIQQLLQRIAQLIMENATMAAMLSPTPLITPDEAEPTPIRPDPTAKGRS